MDLAFIGDTLMRLLGALPVTLELFVASVGAGLALAIGITALRASGHALPVAATRFYVFVFRGTPLLVQLFLIYYGLAQFDAVRHGVLWPVLRDPFWCAVIAMALNTAAYTSEIFRGGLAAVPRGEVEAARAYGLSGLRLWRRIVVPLALRRALPAYATEIVLMVKATALASIVTVMEMTGVAQKIIARSYRAIEVFLVAGAIYLALTFLITRAVALAEARLDPRHRRRRRAA
jgi:octopine/nopaline transport system permease protein